MFKKEKPINEYLEFICALLIDQFNERYQHYTAEQFKKEANERYCERDWVYKIGEFFKELAFFETRRDGGQGHNDISIPSKDFIIEVKYLRNWRDSNDNKRNKGMWPEYEKDFNWLQNEIVNGKKSKRAVVMIWCNCIDYFGQVMQLGLRKGNNPPVNKDRLVYFPFLMNGGKKQDELLTNDLVNNYEKPFPCQLDLNTIGKGHIGMDCLFLGRANDRIHAVIYY